MELELLRVEHDPNFTFGLLFDDTAVKEFLCQTLEDERRETKIPGETRIPAGRYPIELRKEGGMNQRYRQRFGNDHRGMLWIQCVPNFIWIYIHIGNFENETDGCILVGESTPEQRDKGFLGNSRETYLRVYKLIADRIEAGEPVWITIKDMNSSVSDLLHD